MCRLYIVYAPQRSVMHLTILYLSHSHTHKHIITDGTGDHRSSHPHRCTPSLLPPTGSIFTPHSRHTPLTPSPLPPIFTPHSSLPAHTPHTLTPPSHSLHLHSSPLTPSHLTPSPLPPRETTARELANCLNGRLFVAGTAHSIMFCDILNTHQ